ncbi:response regulator transcription factor [Sutterella sp.]|uniref:response regulator transcription factor n=1 Tax=Sutterella sp. TaxID=1981025 RepID=UPI003FD77C00
MTGAAFSFFSPRPGCILSDIRMPAMSGLELQGELMRRGIMLPVIFITGHGDIEMVVNAIQAGACDFLVKPVKEARLFASLEKALAQTKKPEETHRHRRAHGAGPSQADLPEDGPQLHGATQSEHPARMALSAAGAPPSEAAPFDGKSTGRISRRLAGPRRSLCFVALSSKDHSVSCMSCSLREHLDAFRIDA